MSDTPENNTPSVDDIKAQVRQELQSQFEQEKQKIIGNRDQILEEKRQLEQRFKGIDPDKLEKFEEYQKRVQQDEELQLIEQGKIDDVIRRRLEGREKAWNETQAEYEARLKKQTEQYENLSSEYEQLKAQNYDMTVKNYLKDLVGKDDSFKPTYFEEFKAIYGPRVDVDQETGNVYAKGPDGKRLIDVDGNFVPFDKFYAKQKMDSGLFWNGGSGSGMRGAGSDSDGLGGDPKRWTAEQRNQFIANNGYEAYSEILARNAKKK